MRRTKIVVTLGPATDSPGNMAVVLEAVSSDNQIIAVVQMRPIA